MNTTEIVISFIIGALIVIVYKVVRAMRDEAKRLDDYSRSKELSRLICEVMDYDSKVDYALSLRKVQEDALQKIKAICGHQGVQVKIGDGHYDPTITPSIDIIKSLGFMKDYLPEIEELWQIYKDTDSDAYIRPFFKKQLTIHKELMFGPSDAWKLLTDEQKRKIIQDMSYEYDQKQINKKDQENLIAQ